MLVLPWVLVVVVVAAAPVVLENFEAEAPGPV
jgi:hypothetical protein